MPSIRDLTVAIRQRPGIEAVVVLGRDGLLIDAQSNIPVKPGRFGSTNPRSGCFGR